MLFVAADGKTTGSRFWVINRFNHLALSSNQNNSFFYLIKTQTINQNSKKIKTSMNKKIKKSNDY
jgi:hypothetical protein